jgi:N-formylglutamate deformylase
MVPVILHIPHASTAIPAEALTDFSVGRAELDRHLALMTDHFTDELYRWDDPGVSTVKHEVSRLVVDPERFEDDAKEVMAARGQGVLYERGADGSTIRPSLSAERREWLLSRWYRPHHDRLTRAVSTALDSAGRVLIIDAHSFPQVPLALALSQGPDRPDICIGTSGIHTPSALVETAGSWAAEQGWSLGVDTPYSGSIVPSRYYGQRKDVMSVMIEINRRRYMTLDNNTALKSDSFGDARRFVQGLLQQLRRTASAGLLADPD